MWQATSDTSDNESTYREALTEAIEYNGEDDYDEGEGTEEDIDETDITSPILAEVEKTRKRYSNIFLIPSALYY